MFCFKKSILIFVFVFILLGTFLVFAYDSETTHPLLTKRAIELYNQFYQSNLSQQEISWIVEGSQKEDVPPRWINHFYDPITGLGWQGERMGELPKQVVLFFSQMGLSPEQAVSSLNWAKNQDLQIKYSYYEGNQTWQKAINEYAQGNKKQAYIALGHILHLLQDLSVPAHTRQDTHLDALGDPGEPYEKWAKENSNLSFLNNLSAIDFNCSSLEDFTEV